MVGCLRLLIASVLIFFVGILFLQDGVHIHIYDHYYVDNDGFGEGVYLWTNPGYSNAPFLENLQSIQ